MNRPRYIPWDTLPEAYEVQIEAYRRMGGKGRTAVMFRLSGMARQIAAAGIRERHPDYDEEQVRMALFRLLFGDDLSRRVWPERDPVDP